MRSLKRRLCFSIIVLVLFGVIQTHAQCTPLKGTENLWTLPSLHWLLIGELHGSNEAPEAVIDIVCDALAHGRQITVALERPTREQTALEGMLLEPDVEKARQRLLKEPGWRVDPDSANIPDGRTSQAMLCLLIALRELHKRDATLSVAAFDAPFTGSDPGARDAVLGSTLLALGNAEPTKLIVVLTGNLHVMQSPVHGYDLAAMKLPAAQRLSLEVTDKGGDSWSSNGHGCGVYSGGVGNNGMADQRGIFLDPRLAPFGKVDGILSLGQPLTASLPAAGEPSPLLACRVQYQTKPHP